MCNILVLKSEGKPRHRRKSFKIYGYFKKLKTRIYSDAVTLCKVLKPNCEVDMRSAVCMTEF